MNILEEQQAHADGASQLKVAFDDAIQSQGTRKGGAYHNIAACYKKKTLKKKSKQTWILGVLIEIIVGKTFEATNLLWRFAGAVKFKTKELNN